MNTEVQHSRNLFELEQELFNTLTAFNDTLDGIENADEQVAITAEMSEYLNQLAGQEQDAIDSFGRLHKRLKAEVEYLSNLNKQITARRDTVENRIDRIREAVRQVLIMANLQKIKGHVHTVSLSKRTNAEYERPAEELPEQYRESIVTFKPLWDDIKKALESGQDVPGAKLTTTTSLMVR